MLPGALLIREHGVALPLQQRLTGPGVLDRYHVWGQARPRWPSSDR